MERKYKNIQTALDKLPRYDRKNGYYVEIFTTPKKTRYGASLNTVWALIAGLSIVGTQKL